MILLPSSYIWRQYFFDYGGMLQQKNTFQIS